MRSLSHVGLTALIALVGLAGQATAQSLNVVVIQSTIPSVVNETVEGVQASFAADGRVTATVDMIEMSTAAVPTVAELQAYDVVMVAPRATSVSGAIRAAYGDVLADFVDAGGAVLTFFTDSVPTLRLQGRWQAGGYQPIGLGPFLASEAFLTTLVEPDHPLFTGTARDVTTVRVVQHSGSTVVPVGAQALARFGDGTVAAAESHGGRVVGLGFYPTRLGDTPGLGYDEQTPGAELIVNAVLYLVEVAEARAKTILVDKGTTVEVTPQMWAYAYFAPVTIEVLVAPEHGELLLDNTPIGVGAVFSSRRIAEGRVKYRHGGSDDGLDPFLVKVSAGSSTFLGPIAVIVDDPSDDDDRDDDDDHDDDDDDDHDFRFPFCGGTPRGNGLWLGLMLIGLALVRTGRRLV